MGSGYSTPYHEALREPWFNTFKNDENIYSAWQQYRQYAKDESEIKLLQSIKDLLTKSSAKASNVEYTSHWARQVRQLLSNTIELLIKEKEMKNEEGDMQKGNQQNKHMVTVKEAQKVHYGDAFIGVQHVKATAENAQTVATAVDFLAASKEKRQQARQAPDEKKKKDDLPAIVHFEKVESFQQGDLHDDSIHFEEITAQAVLATKHNSPVFSNPQASQPKASNIPLPTIESLTCQPLADDDGEYYQVFINYSKIDDEVARQLQEMLQGGNGLKASSCFREPEKTRTRKGYIQRLDFDNEGAAKHLCEVANQFIEAEQLNEQKKQSNSARLLSAGK